MPLQDSRTLPRARGQPPRSTYSMDCNFATGYKKYVYKLPRISMRLAAHGHVRRKKPRLSTTRRPPGGARTRTPQCDAAKRSMTLVGILPDGLAIRYEEATAILYEPGSVGRDTQTLRRRARQLDLA
jgi:hypothetical protein